jgi:hypothetical protein
MATNGIKTRGSLRSRWFLARKNWGREGVMRRMGNGRGEVMSK